MKNIANKNVMTMMEKCVWICRMYLVFAASFSEKVSITREEHRSA